MDTLVALEIGATAVLLVAHLAIVVRNRFSSRAYPPRQSLNVILALSRLAYRPGTQPSHPADKAPIPHALPRPPSEPGT